MFRITSFVLLAILALILATSTAQAQSSDLYFFGFTATDASCLDYMDCRHFREEGTMSARCLNGQCFVKWNMCSMEIDPWPSMWDNDRGVCQPPSIIPQICQEVVIY